MLFHVNKTVLQLTKSALLAA